MSAGTTQTDPDRLPTTMVPSRYRLRLEPHLEAASFGGSAEIDVDVAEPTQAIVLNAHQLEIVSPLVRAADGRSTAGTVDLDEELQRATLSFPDVLEAGHHTLSR